MQVRDKRQTAEKNLYHRKSTSEEVPTHVATCYGEQRKALKLPVKVEVNCGPNNQCHVHRKHWAL